MPRKKTTKKTTARKTKGRKTTAKRKPTAKKTTAKRASARKTAKKTTVKKSTVKVGKTPFKKSDIYNYISEQTELTRKDIVSVFDALSDVIQGHLKKSGPGEFTLPGLLKIKVHRKPATKARKGINPFTGEEMTFKAKPARNVAKVRPLKKLKEMVS